MSREREREQGRERERLVNCFVKKMRNKEKVILSIPCIYLIAISSELLP